MIDPNARMFPPGSFGTVKKGTGGPKLHRNAPLAVCQKLPGSMEWAFYCINTHGAIPTFGALTNITPSIPSFFLVPPGFEGVITWIEIGPNVIPTSGGSGTWFPGLVCNQVGVPGWYPLPNLKATDGFGNWWTEAEIYLEENSLVQLVKLGDSLGGGNPADIGGSVHGYIWPIRSRERWESTHGRSPGSSES